MKEAKQKLFYGHGPYLYPRSALTGNLTDKDLKAAEEIYGSSKSVSQSLRLQN